mgnify:CR=1 FL=1
MKQEQQFAQVTVPLAPDNDYGQAADSYNTFAKQGFDGNTVVNSCIREIATAVSAPKFLLEQLTAEGGSEQLTTINNDIAAVLESPNAEQSQSDLIELLTVYLYTSGNAYVLKERNRSGRIISLQLLRPDRITIDIEHGSVHQYEYEINGSTYYIPASEIAHIKLPNAADDVYGLSPLQVCSRYVNLDISIADFTKSYFANSGIPAGLLKLKRRINSQEEANSTRSKWRSSFSGKNGWGNLAVLDEDASYESISPPLKDMDTAALTRTTETRICATFGVPPILLGLQSGLEVSSYSNYEQARESFISETVAPLVSKLADFLYRALEVGSRERNVVVRAATEDVKAFQEDVNAISLRISKQFTDGIISLNEARAALGYDALENGDGRRITSWVLEVSPDDDVDLSVPANLREAAAPQLLKAGIPVQNIKKVPVLPRAVKLNQTLSKQREDLTEILEADLVKYFKKLADQVAGKMGRLIERSASSETQVTKIGIDDVNPSGILPPDGRGGLSDVIRNGYGQIIKSTWDTVLDSGVAGALDFDDRNPIVTQIMQSADVTVTEMWNETERAVGKAVNTAVERGYSIDQLARGVPDQNFPGVNSLARETYANRARTIARTEVMRAMNATTLGYYEAQEVEYVQAYDPDGDPADNYEGSDGRTCSQRNEQIYPIKQSRTVVSHPNCRLSWSPLSSLQVEELGLVDTVALEASIDFIKVQVPVYMQQNAARGLQYLDQGHVASGATEQIVDEAVGLAHGNVSDDKVLRMNDWYKEHFQEMNSPASSNPESPNFPSAEAVTFLLWGGDPLKPDQSMKWAEKQAELLKEEMTNGIQTVSN